jgi:hypothetical protein
LGEGVFSLQPSPISLSSPLSFSIYLSSPLSFLIALPIYQYLSHLPSSRRELYLPNKLGPPPTVIFLPSLLSDSIVV